MGSYLSTKLFEIGFEGAEGLFPNFRRDTPIIPDHGSTETYGFFKTKSVYDEVVR